MTAPVAGGVLAVLDRGIAFEKDCQYRTDLIEARATVEAMAAALCSAREWHLGDKWRTGDAEQRNRWQEQIRRYEEVLAAYRGEAVTPKPVVQVGTIGHVDHHKTTLTAALIKLGQMQQPATPAKGGVPSTDWSVVEDVGGVEFVPRTVAEKRILDAMQFVKAQSATPAGGGDDILALREVFGRGVMHSDGRLYFDKQAAEQLRAAFSRLASTTPEQ